LFEVVFGLSPAEYLRRRRLSTAALAEGRVLRPAGGSPLAPRRRQRATGSGLQAAGYRQRALLAAGLTALAADYA